MIQYAKYTDRKEFVKYREFRELLELPCQLLDWRTAVSASGFNCAWKSRVACWEPICTKSNDCYSHSLCYHIISKHRQHFKMLVSRDMAKYGNLRRIGSSTRYFKTSTSIPSIVSRDYKFLYNIYKKDIDIEIFLF